jgi:hypothetical protein
MTVKKNYKLLKNDLYGKQPIKINLGDIQISVSLKFSQIDPKDAAKKSFNLSDT